MNLRTMKSGDLDAVLALWLEGNLEAHPFIDPSYFENNLPYVKSALSEARVIVAEEGGILLGFIGLTKSHIEGLFVAAPYRGQGVGKALLDAVKKEHIALTVAAFGKNSGAIRFYKR
ncbi:GNAT family N-acetyltransferase [Acidaminococcus sp.]|uniref:GNAT family N-acetyltransferase n=1 Tax=Acidaminococcus sp. TaxID=1872103 RepID=UPI003AB3ECCC